MSRYCEPEFDGNGHEIFQLDTQSFDIKNELKIRKILEINTDWDIEFNKNGNKFEYDLVYYRWLRKNNELTKTLCGYVEVENSAGNWYQEEWPRFYGEVSCLKRKLYEFDNTTKTKCIWLGPKKNYEKTVYLKFNVPLTNCFCVTIWDVIYYGKESPRSTGSKNNSFIGLPPDSEYITWGIVNCVDRINAFMNSMVLA